MRTYSELMKLPTFEERFEYLKLDGDIGRETFGFDRYINQRFYRSAEWKRIRNEVIVRDNGCDLAIPDRKIFGQIVVHHMNPIDPDDIEERFILDPDFLITTFITTHNAIHYGDKDILVPTELTERKPNDTCLWRD